MQVVRSDIGPQSSDFGYTVYMQDVTELRIYRQALELLPKVYELAKTLPYTERELRSQMCNAAKSITAQIAEGFAKKNSQVEFKRFLYMALGSSDETITHIRQVHILFPEKSKACGELIQSYKSESRQMNALIQKIRNPISEV